MGWSDCGTDSEGRPIGYGHEANCDHPGCENKIDRGLSYVCGTMHGSDEYSCDKYFCEEHRSNFVEMSDGDITRICDDCAKGLLESNEWFDDDGLLSEKQGEE